MMSRLPHLSAVLAVILALTSAAQTQEAANGDTAGTATEATNPLEMPAGDAAGEGTGLMPRLTPQPFQAPAATPAVPALPTNGQTSVRLAALLTPDGKEIPSGVTWRIFGLQQGTNGRLPLVATTTGGAGEFRLKPGSYLVHAAYGRAGATKRISVGKEADRENVVLDAGGLKLNALLAGGKKIPPGKLRFSVYEDKPDAVGNRPLVIPDVKPNAIVRLNAGVYHVVSNYGSVNAVVRSDIRVEAGKLTEAMVEHQAAQLTLKLVREAGGEALAETSWSVVNDSGDPVTETVGPYATLVLAEGTYVVIAKNRENIFQKELTVASGQDAEVEIVADEKSRIDPNEGAE